MTAMRWWHIADVVELESRLFPDDAWSIEQFWQELAQDTRSYVVALGEEGVVGYAGAFLVPPDSDLQTIAVAPDHQGQGIAGALLATLIDTAAESGCTHMVLEVREDNSGAITLYERNGFERISQRPRYYADGAAAIIMRRRFG